MTVEHVAIYKCDGQYCSTTARVPSSEWQEYGYQTEQRALEKRGWSFGGLASGFKALCKKCTEAQP